VAITATTGIAGLNIGGCTIHSFAGIKFGKEEPHILAAQIVGSKKLRKRWRKTQVLIIDEGTFKFETVS
jgi:ATP-dependent DNA helicase PIF1